MSDFQSSLLREKFTITDKKEPSPILAMSNRLIIHNINKVSLEDEYIIIRTQNMHSCARLAAFIMRDFYDHGLIVKRFQKEDWQYIWKETIKGYDRDWNPDIWCTIYHKGRILYQDGVHHPFLDIIEQCDAAQKNEYKESIYLAEKIFQQAGKNVKIDHDSHAALLVNCVNDTARTAVILRSGGKSTTFSFQASENPKTKIMIKPHTIMHVASLFLEFTQLVFQKALLNKRKEYGLIEKSSRDEKHYAHIYERINSIHYSISRFEEDFIVKYRPEKPMEKILMAQCDPVVNAMAEKELKEKEG